MIELTNKYIVEIYGNDYDNNNGWGNEKYLIDSREYDSLYVACSFIGNFSTIDARKCCEESGYNGLNIRLYEDHYVNMRYVDSEIIGRSDWADEKRLYISLPSDKWARPTFDITFARGYDLNGHTHLVVNNEHVDEVCPVCGSTSINCDQIDDGMDFSVISRSYYCEECGSEFTYTWKISSIHISKAGKNENEGE